MKLDLILALFDQKVADRFRNSISDVSNDQVEVGIDSLSELHDEDSSTAQMFLFILVSWYNISSVD